MTTLVVSARKGGVVAVERLLLIQMTAVMCGDRDTRAMMLSASGCSFECGLWVGCVCVVMCQVQ